MTHISDKDYRENRNAFYVRYFFSPRKSCRLWDNVQKYGRAWQATDDNMAHSRCMLDTWGYNYTCRLCNIYCLSTATMVERTPLNATFYVHCLFLL